MAHIWLCLFWRESKQFEYNILIILLKEKLFIKWFLILQQTSEPKFPDIMRIAISKQGVTVIHPKTKVSSIDNSFKQAFCPTLTAYHVFPYTTFV